MLEKKLPNMTPIEVQIADTIIQRTQNRLQAMYDGVTERGIKAIFLVNGGGIVAILTTAIKNCYMFLSLICFLLGISLSLGLVSMDYYIGMRLLNNYIKNINKFSNAEIKFSETENYSNKNFFWLGLITIIVGYSSAVLSLTGILLGVIGYLGNAN